MFREVVTIDYSIRENTFGDTVQVLWDTRGRLERGLLVLVYGKVEWMEIKGLKDCTHATRRDFCFRISSTSLGLGGPASSPIPVLTHNW